MPFARRRRRQPRQQGRSTGSRKSAARRLYRKKKPTSAIVRGITAFADIQRVKLQYTQYNSLVGTLGALAINLFRGNSVNDPDSTGVGHQPMGHDQWSNFYDRYLVTGCAIKVEFINVGTPNAFVAIMAKDTNSVVTTVSVAGERANSKYKILTPDGSSRRTKMSMYRTTRKMLGLNNKVTTDDDQYTAAVASDPTFQWYYHVVSGALDGSSTSGVEIYTTLTYYVTYYDRKTLSQS